MKYAYIIGSSAFVAPSKVISYTDHGKEKEFLKVNSIYHDQSTSAPETFLSCDFNIDDGDGNPVTVIANKLAAGGAYTVKTQRDSVQVLNQSGKTVIHIHQLDDETAMSLEHNITAELEVNMPIAVIRISGEFMLGSLLIRAENEKLFINDNGYANSVLAGDNQLKFTEEGVVL
jgi:hypothetical protein